MKNIGIHDERGVALVLALLVVVLLMLLGTMFLTVSMTESTISSNAVKRSKSFNIAEGGLELAKRNLKMSTATSLNVFLTGTTPGPYPFGDTPGAGNTFDGGNYIVRIYDNNDDADPNNDTDDIVFVESTGCYQSNQSRIVSLVKIPLVPDPDGAVETIAAGETEIELEKGATIDGANWDAPADISACTTIATCGTPVAGVPIAGASANAVKFEVDVKAPSVISGAPPTKLNPSLSTAKWDLLIDQILPYAARTMTVPEKLTGTHTWGTPSAPEITVITGKKIEIETGAVVNGAGVLIIDNIGELELDHGIFNWQGLILVRGSAQLEVEFDDDTDATSRIFGGLVLMTNGTDPFGDGEEIELEIENTNSFIKYSRSSINLARDFLPITIQNWAEVEPGGGPSACAAAGGGKGKGGP